VAGLSVIALGQAHTCAIEEGGGVKCWGANWDGQLGIQGTMFVNSPTAVSGARGYARR
jgi:alpha-tubulin suppressor-like RCC1 family protein